MTQNNWREKRTRGSQRQSAQPDLKKKCLSHRNVFARLVSKPKGGLMYLIILWDEYLDASSHLHKTSGLVCRLSGPSVGLSIGPFVDPSVSLPVCLFQNI